ncbi:MAG TPA: DUF1906 domain-containing protein [Solirubrobacteraceae bacterium]|nr:DUF1906 domain-containing protein [Solirubrobacteraceae bacterium]
MNDIVCWGSKRSRLVSGAGRTVHGMLGTVLVALLCAALLAPAAASAATRVVRYHGLRLNVPVSWPVYDLSRHPRLCVRFDRHAVYLGRPSADPLCPPDAIGRTEALLVEPVIGRAADGGAAAGLVSAPSAAADRRGGSAGELVRSGVRILATWGAHPAVLLRVIGLRSLKAFTHPQAPRPVRMHGLAMAARSGRTRTGTPTPAGPGQVFTGLGFDACSAPSASAMNAWLSSPDRAVGIYIGGTNAACSQPNLTSTWVSQQAAAGWHMIPIYVGLQAPKNSCGCAGISPSSAASEGTAAATDAVTQAQALGIGTGNPIYFDMEGYSHTSANTTAVLTFLAAWTAQLHASGYKSGVYSSNASGITDLVAQYGTSYPEPDDLWPATWDGQQNTVDSYVPATEWAAHQRINQYDGGQNETYGGVTMNVDDDYVDALTAAAGAADPPPPTLQVAPASDGSITLKASWSAVPSVSSWQILAGTSTTTLTPAAAPVSSPTVVVHSAFPYFAVNALSATGQVIGTSAPAATPAYLALFGHELFVPPRGLGAVPVGCFSPVACHVRLTLSSAVGGMTTGTEYVPVGGGLVYFNLPARARAALAHSPRGIPVTATVRDRSGISATRAMTLTPFTTSGRSPRRSSTAAPSVRIAGLTAFVSNAWVGGILTACRGTAPCRMSATVTVGRTVIARTGREFLGLGELGYIIFPLTPAGHAMLRHAAGNQLGASVTMTNGTDQASARVVLVAFG